MRKFVYKLMVLVVLLLTGCGGATPEPVATTAPLPTSEPTQVATVDPTAEPTQVVDYCVGCHTDREQLVATAKPEEEVEAESSGVG
jgi:uncharacterized lipoprotein YmbA